VIQLNLIEHTIKAQKNKKIASWKNREIPEWFKVKVPYNAAR
jgi:hypothetical protein